jgi:hypothetical protein
MNIQYLPPHRPRVGRLRRTHRPLPSPPLHLAGAAAAGAEWAAAGRMVLALVAPVRPDLGPSWPDPVPAVLDSTCGRPPAEVARRSCRYGCGAVTGQWSCSGGRVEGVGRSCDGLALATLVLARDGRGSAIGGRMRARCWPAGALRGSRGMEEIVRRPRVGGVLTVTNDLF